MNNHYRKTSILVGALLLMNVAFADDHGASAQSATMAQVNLCYLEDGKTMADVDDLNGGAFLEASLLPPPARLYAHLYRPRQLTAATDIEDCSLARQGRYEERHRNA